MNRHVDSCRCLAIVTLMFGLHPTTSLADDLTFVNTCSNIWQDCCDCNEDMKCINWNVPPFSAPVCPAFPSVSDNVTISQDCEVSDLFAAAVAGTITQTAGTLTLNHHLLMQSDATIDGPIVWNDKGFAHTSGTDSFTSITSNGGITMQGADDKFLGGWVGFILGAIELINNGDSTWSGTGDWTIGSNGAFFRNSATGSFDVQNNSSIFRNAGSFGVIDNQGTLTKSAGGGVSNWNINLINDGFLHVQSGGIELTGQGEASGEFRVDAGAALTFATIFGFEFKPGISFTGDELAVLADTGSSVGVLVKETIDLNRFRVESSGALGPASEADFGHINVTELFQIDDGQVFPPITVKPGARIEATGSSQSRVGDLNVEGTVDVMSGKLSSFNKVIDVRPGGIVEIRDGASFESVGLVSQPIENNGTVQKTSGPGVATIDVAFNRTFNNNTGGLVWAGTGTMALPTECNSSGDWRADAGAVIELTKTTNADVGSTWTGDGTFRVAGDGAGATLNFADGVVLTPANFELGDANRPGRIRDLGATIGDITVSDRFRFIRGDFDDLQAVDLHIPEGATIDFEGSTTMGMGATNLTLGGTANVIGSAAVDVKRSPIWTIDPTGMLDIQSDVIIGNFVAFPTYNNAGTIVKSAGAGTSTMILPNVNNTGTVLVESGVLFLNASSLGGFVFSQTAGVTQVDAGATLIVNEIMNLSGGCLQGGGTLSANPNVNGATVKPGASVGMLTIASNASPAIAGHYSQASGGTLEIELAGLAGPGTGHDQLIVAGTATLAGTLKLTAVDAFVPAIGNSFVILTANNVNDEFESKALVNFPPGLDVDVVYSDTTVTVNVVAVSCPNTCADVNGDAGVDLNDFLIFVQCFDGDPTVSQDCTCSDVNGDLAVDLNDLIIFVNLFDGISTNTPPNCP